MSLSLGSGDLQVVYLSEVVLNELWLVEHEEERLSEAGMLSLQQRIQ